MADRYTRLSISLKYYLLGKGYHTALKAMAFGKECHNGVRKDRITPEFQHQIEIGLFITTLKDVELEELTLTTALLHDVMEDHDVTKDTLVSKFGPEVYELVWLLTDRFKGVKKSLGDYYYQIGNNPIASIAKGADRVHNVRTMVGVFTAEKQKSYILEVQNLFIPMLKTAKNNFPQQSAAYFNILHMLRTQSDLVNAALTSTLEGSIST